MSNEPKTQEEYEKRFRENERVTGHGIRETRVHMPCPFCAAPDFLVYPIIESTKAMREGATCGECGRSMKAKVEETGNSTTITMMQTGGPCAPPWVPIARS